MCAMTRRAGALLSLALLSIVSCQSQSPDAVACETVDEIAATFLADEDLEGYVTSTEDLALELDEVDDQLLRDVGTSLYIVALQWRESGYEDEQLREANTVGVNLLANRCEELRG